VPTTAVRFVLFSVVRLVLFSAVAAATASCAGRAADPVATSPGRVTRVVDGDTVDVEVAGARQRVRLIGIDTPETHRPGTPVECFGPEAAARLAELLPPGTEVAVEPDVEPHDRYQRTLGYLHRRHDGLFVNVAMVRDGFAADYAYPPNTRHADELAIVAGEARLASRGLWGACRGPHVPAVQGDPRRAPPR
jgi:micrococcal nuclease